MAREIERSAKRRRRSLRSGVDRRHDRRHQVLQPAFLLVREPRSMPLERRSVDQRHRDPHQSNAIGDRMMHAEHHGRPAVVFFDDMYGPEWMVGIERLRGELADEALERRLVAAPRQVDPFDVVGEIEVRVVAPEDAGGRVIDLLPIAPIAQQPIRDLLLDLVESDRPLKYPHADDHHRIGRPVHAQPGRVDRRHALVVAHLPLLSFPTISRSWDQKQSGRSLGGRT